MKHAYLIIAHKNWKILNFLLEILDDPQNDFYLLIDKKVKKPVKSLININLKKSKLVELSRIKINWGGYSQIQAELHLLKTAINGNYDYYHFFQGSDFPIKNKKSIDLFFSKNYGKEFIEFSPNNYEFAKWKCCYYHFGVDNRLYRRSILLKLLSHSCVKLQKLFRLEKSIEPLYHGSALFSITHSCAQYIVKSEEAIFRKFYGSIAADEVFLQTIIMQSPFKKKIYHFEQSDGNARYIDWNHREKNSPRTFSKEDFIMLMSLPEQYCFARKFSDENIELVEKIVEELKKYDSNT